MGGCFTEDKSLQRPPYSREPRLEGSSCPFRGTKGDSSSLAGLCRSLIATLGSDPQINIRTLPPLNIYLHPVTYKKTLSCNFGGVGEKTCLRQNSISSGVWPCQIPSLTLATKVFATSVYWEGTWA